MSALYPLKFTPVFKEKIWGGQQIRKVLQKDFSPLPNCGEMWVVSGIPGDESVVQNGELEGNTLNELCEIFMDELLGEKIYDKFGEMFPLLVKIIDTTDWLSVQVHPDDELAATNHGEAYGKTEMWYILKASHDATLISGFKESLNKATFIKSLANKTLTESLNIVPVEAGDVYFIPAGRVHAIGGHILLAEIQQSSDITYRIYDWDRFDVNGLPRELHTDLATEAINFEVVKDAKSPYLKRKDAAVPLIECPQFTTRLLELQKPYLPDYHDLDSFVILLCTEGSLVVSHETGEENITAGEAVLIPACVRHIELKPAPQANILEIFIA